jgi:hypothetical protein
MPITRSWIVVVFAGMVGCGDHAPISSAEPKATLQSSGPVSVLITISADPARDAIDRALRSELSKFIPVRFISDGDNSAVDLKVDVLITSLPDDGAVLTVSTETGGLFRLRAIARVMKIDPSAKFPQPPYAARKVIARQNVQQACAEVAAGINEAVFERYLEHARKRE